MCTGIVGHCQCLKCLDHPVPGKLLRIDFCDKQQEELTGIWTNFLPHERRLVPCSKLKFDRVRNPDSCHFKNEVVQEGTSSTEPIHTAAGKEPEEPSSSRTTFTPINAAQVALAKAALAISTEAQDTVTAASSPLSSGDNQDKIAIDALCALSAANLRTTGSQPNTPPEQQESTSNEAGAAVTGTPTRRTPLPSNRLCTPNVLQATAAAAAAVVAAETAGHATGGQWTHAETIKLLVLKAKGFGYENMGDVSTSPASTRYWVKWY